MDAYTSLEMQNETAELIVFVEDAEVACHILRVGPHTLGTSSECTIRVDAAHVSRLHARLTVVGDGTFRIEDLGSSNGTFIDGKATEVPTTVTPDQCIQVGAATLRVRPTLQSHSEDEDIPSDASDTIMSYEIGAEIASGGMGAVLAARQPSLRREVAMKVLLDHASPRDHGRFVREAQITSLLEHPNIVPVHDFGVDPEGRPFYTMKRVNGSNLKELLALLAADDHATVRKWPLAGLITVFQKICDSVALAHSKGIIHRDLKPANLMVGEFGEVLVMDWGIAKLLDRGSDRPTSPTSAIRQAGADDRFASIASAVAPDDFATMDGAVIGTPQYMSPEQANGETRALDERSDIFSLGTILYEIVTLVPAFGGKTSAEILSKVQSGHFVTPRVCLRQAKKSRRRHLPGGTVPRSLEAVIVKALALEPDLRYCKVEDLQADLTAYQAGFATSAENAGLWKQATLLAMRHKAAALGLVAVLLVAGTLGVRIVLESKRAAREAMNAIAESQRAERGAVLATAQSQRAREAAAQTIAEGKRAEQEAARAVTESQRAEKALAELKKTAPDIVAGAFLASGNSPLDSSPLSPTRFDRALDKIATALLLDPELTTAHWRRGWLLLAQGKLPESIAALQLAQQKDPKNVKYADLIPMVEKMAAAPEADRYSSVHLIPIHRLLKQIGANPEIAELQAKFLRTPHGKHYEAVQQALEQRLGKTPSNLKPLYTVSPMIFETSVRLDGPRFGSLETLRGLEINVLFAENARVTSLEPLRGMPLVELRTMDNLIQDLGPLKGMPLQSLTITNNPVQDISALRGMPLVSLYAQNCPIQDLSPLAHSPLEALFLNSPQISNLSPLATTRLNNLSLHNISTTDLQPLAGLPLRFLKITSTQPKEYDLKPLLEIQTLEHLTITCPLKSLLSLRDHPRLKILIWNRREFAMADFWKEYDNGQLTDISSESSLGPRVNP